ncbi:MAG: signal peptidase II [Oscillospiraceae bacterium]|nr:signal peptidase II [Oscillospiraceae bacterium]
MIYFLAVVLCVVLDQGVKLWTVGNLALHESAPLLPGIVELYYIQNTGGGFSILTGHTWLLTVVTAVLLTGFAVLLIKKVFTHPLAVWTLVLVIGGGIGNLIDRVRLGYVVDMFNFQFMSYPVFNVADIFVVCGAIGFSVYYLLLHDKVVEKTEKKTEEVCNDEDNPAVS